MCLNFSTCVCLCKLFFCVKQSRSLHGWWVYFNPAERSCVWFVCLPGCLFAFCIWVSEVWGWDVETALSEVTETTDLNSDPHNEISLLLSGISQRSRVTIRASPEDEFIVSHCDSLFVVRIWHGSAHKQTGKLQRNWARKFLLIQKKI